MKMYFVPGALFFDVLAGKSFEISEEQSTKHKNQSTSFHLSHSASADSRTTIVCDRSGPVEIKPICTPI